MNAEKLMQCGRGCWQYDICHGLASGGWVLNPASEARFGGRAKSYIGKYRKSWAALYSRIIAAGFKIEYRPGPRGGAYKAVYRIVI